MKSDSKQLIGVCHSCLRTKPLNEIMYSRRFHLADSKEPDFRDDYRSEFSKDMGEFKNITFGQPPTHNFAAIGFESWLPKDKRSNCAIEWKTMETSMEDGLLGRAAVSRNSSEQISKGYAESSDHLPYIFDSLYYGSRLDYKRRLRKASLFRELRGDYSSVEGSTPEFFEGMCMKCLPEDLNPPSSNDECLDCDMSLSQNGCVEEKVMFANTSQRSADDQEDVSESCEATESSNDLGSSNFEQSEMEEDRDAKGKEVEVPKRRSGNFPPPLSSLVRRTSSFLPHKVPAVLLQPIRSKGRFILQEVHVATQMVFQPIREDGRLLLKLFRQSNPNTEVLHGSQVKSEEAHITVAESHYDIDIESKINPTGVGDSKLEQLYQSQYTEEELHKRKIAVTQLEQASKLDLADSKIAQDSDNQASNRFLFSLEEILSGHLDVQLQTIQQQINLFQTLQHHQDKEFSDELVRSFAARALKLTLCKAALTNAEGKLASIDHEKAPSSICQIRLTAVADDHIDHDTLNMSKSSYDNDYLKDRELCQRDHTVLPKMFQVASHKGNMLVDNGLQDTQDNSVQQCRTYKSNIRQGEEGLMPRWEAARCIAT